MFIIKKAPFSKTTDSATQPKQKHVRKNNKRQKVLSQTKGMESIVKINLSLAFIKSIWKSLRNDFMLEQLLKILKLFEIE